MPSGIYFIGCTGNGKGYVGYSKNVPERLGDHKSALKRNAYKRKRPYMQASYNKYGEDTFQYCLIEECSPDILAVREKFWIEFLGTKLPWGFNQTDGGEGVVNPTEEVREKLRQATIGNKRGLGRIVSQETRQKISKAHQGKVLSPETRQKISEVQKGKVQSPEWIAMMTEHNKGNQYSKGFKHTSETKAKMSASRSGEKHWKNKAGYTTSEETRQKTSKSLKRFYRILRQGWPCELREV